MLFVLSGRLSGRLIRRLQQPLPWQLHYQGWKAELQMCFPSLYRAGEDHVTLPQALGHK